MFEQVIDRKPDIDSTDERGTEAAENKVGSCYTDELLAVKKNIWVVWQA